MTGYQSGKWAELLASLYLRLHGYRLIGRNFKTGRGTTAGEIDIIVIKKNLLVFVEVKKRRSLDEAAYAISAKQQQRLLRGAQNFVKRHPQYREYDLRFDAVLVKLPLSLRHIPNAWTS